MLSIAAACANVPPAEPATGKPDSCIKFEPIRQSKAQQDELDRVQPGTQRQIDEHNAGWYCDCEGFCPASER